MKFFLVAIALQLALPRGLASFNFTNHARCSISNTEWSTMHDPDSTNHTQAKLLSRAAGGIGRWHRPWPVTDWEHYGKLRVIEYCFNTLADRPKLWCGLQKAIGLWHDHLGGPASPQAGHNLAFNEYLDDDGNPIPCYDTWDDANERGVWNEYVPHHVVSIKEDGRTAYSSIGYIAEDTEVMRHHIRLPMPPVENSQGYAEAIRFWLQTAAHEVRMGHSYLVSLGSRVY
jgi:hypothetical protein